MMKKLILSVCVMLTSLAAMAQNEVGTVTLQPKVGLNMANVTEATGSDPRFAFAVGGELEYQVTDMVSVAGGLLYSMQGVKFNVSPVNTTLKLDYVNIPIVANVYVAKGLAVKLGLQPGFLINNKIKVSQGSTSAEVNLKAAGYEEKINKFDLSLPIGLSYEFNNIVVDARYNFGLTKITELGGKNSVFQLTAGYKFTL